MYDMVGRYMKRWKNFILEGTGDAGVIFGVLRL
jgi:hypothetical protein